MEVFSLLQPLSPPSVIRFGSFEVDLASSELRKSGLRLRIQQQPFQVLAALLARPNEVVSREELRALLWPDGTFVDYERGLNAAVARPRQVLQDSAETARFIETVARRGYRFIAPVTTLPGPASAPSPPNGKESAPAMNGLPLSTGPVAEQIAALTEKPQPTAKANTLKRVLLALALGLLIAAVYRLAHQDAEPRGVRRSQCSRLGVRWTSGRWRQLWMASDCMHWECKTAASWSVTTRLPGNLLPYLGGISAYAVASRDGQWNAYISYPDGALWRSRMDGTDRLQLTLPPMRVMLPRWSPDRRRIAFAAQSAGEPWAVYVVSADGGGPERVLNDRRHQNDPSWSPDGNSLAFGRLPWLEHKDAVPDITIVNLRTKEASILPGSERLSSPRWSPDGRYMVAVTAVPPQHRIALFDFSTQRWQKVSEPPAAYPT